VRGYLVMLAHLIFPRRVTDPPPGPRRLVKAPVAVHPLPWERAKTQFPPAVLGKGAEAGEGTAVSSK
jgi:hypothetical protein